MEKPILEVRNLKKYFPLRRNNIFSQVKYLKAVNDVSFSVQKGETFGIVGESGCGKSTLGQTLMHLYKPTSGRIIFNGQDISFVDGKMLKELRKKIQIIFQDPYGSLNPRKKIGWILEEPLIIHGMKDRKRRMEKVSELMELAGFSTAYLNRYPSELSGGQRQRICIISSLILEPELIIADEPVSALDVSVQAQILNLMTDLQKNYNLTYIFISHNLNVVHYISTRIAIMYLGEFVEYGQAARIYTAPLHPYTTALFSAVPTLDQNKKERIIIEGELPDPVNPPVGCPFNSRCRHAFERCFKEKPEFTKIDDNHFVKCHLYGKE
ncbi:MAG: dipeptide ABC transporter ATP-binding protein [Petrotogaceae bacterium]|jgi:oligopeptide/dipeptide ABC transporter ATP-binding protein|nr:dipeptide ABC transporter ATP-binding protein [Petrotogaceae bacterium]